MNCKSLLKNGTTLLLINTIAFSTFAQDHGTHADHSMGAHGLAFWFGVFELPFLFLCIFFAFKTAAALKGGVFAKGMNYMAWGFLVMGIGHLNMQLDHFFNFNLIYEIFGSDVGLVVWFLALVATWSLSGFGFYKIFKASKGN